MKIKSIKEVYKNNIDHIDITTEKNHNFFANGILTHNCNLPAKNCVITGIHMGIQEVDELNVIQCAGRSGRYGIDDEGHVYLIIPQGETLKWTKIFANPRPVISVLNERHTLAFHCLAEIQTGNIKDPKSMLGWYNRSLSKIQEKETQSFDIDDAKNLLEELEKMEMINNNSGYPKTTGLGNTSAWLYYSPYDIYDWYKNFKILLQKKPNDDLVLAWAIADTANNDTYITKHWEDESARYMSMLKLQGLPIRRNTTMSVIAAHRCLTGEKGSNGIKPIMRTIKYDIDRNAQALKMIDTNHAGWNSDLWDTLPLRIKYGVGIEAMELVKIPGIGGVRAKKLMDKGIFSKEDLLKNKEKLTKIFTPVFAKKLIENINNKEATK